MGKADSPTFGDLLRAHRLSAGLTQEALAERAGLSARGIQNLERFVTKPLRDTAMRLGRALALPPEEHARFVAAAAPLRRQPRTEARGDRAPMDFDRHVRDALLHLYDPVSLQTHPLTQFVPQDQRQSSATMAKALRQSLVAAIEGLRPGNDAAAPDALRRYRLLSLRYIDGLNAPAVRDQLGISQSTYYREHQRAVEAVISLLRDQWRLGTPAGPPSSGTIAAGTGIPGIPPTPRVELPAYLSAFIGRERQLAEVRRLLTVARLLTLTGPGGVGKTRLAVEVAAGLAGGYPDGIVFVSLAPLRDPDLVLATIAQTLGMHMSDDRPQADRLHAILHDKCMLLVLDNFEHLVTAATHLAGLLTACPRLHALATSREPLRVSGEHEFLVPPMALDDTVPRPSTAIPKTTMPVESEAVRLFVDRARHVRPDFALTPEDTAAVLAICHRLDGLPLAIELAAARVKLLPPRALLGRLDSRLRVLTSGPRDAPARQRTLRAAIDWSYDLLAPEEQVLFQRLAVFVGGCTLAAAEAVGTVASDPSEDPLRGVAALVDQSLLHQEEQPDGEPRYGMLETIREYALERLETSGEAEVVRQRHRDWFLAFAERAAPELTQRGQVVWYRRLAADRDNLRAAMDYSRTQETGAEAELRMAAALGQFWVVRGQREGRARLLDALGRGGPAPTAARAKALTWAGHFESLYGHVAHGRKLLEEGLATARTQGDGALIAFACRFLSLACSEGDGAAAVIRPLLEEGLAAAMRAGDRYEEAYAMVMLGALPTDDRQQRARQLEAGLELARGTGDHWLISQALRFCGIALLHQGHAERARPLLEEAIAHARAIDFVVMAAGALLVLAEAARRQGDGDVARARGQEALGIVREVGSPGHVVRCLLLVANLEADAGRWERAARLLGACDAQPAATGFMGVSLAGLWQQWRDRAAAVRAQLGDEAAAAAWAAGRALTLEQAIAEALEESSGSWAATHS